MNKVYTFFLILLISTIFFAGAVSAEYYIYPKILEFGVSTASTTSSTASNVGSWSYDANFSGTTNVTLGCSFWASSTNVANIVGQWELQSSNNGSTWTSRGTIDRTMSPNTVAGSVYIAGNAYDITDGTRYFRVTHRISSGTGTLTTNDVVCHLRTNKDQNNLAITNATYARGYTTINNATFTNLGGTYSFTAPADNNGFIYSIGSVNYYKIAAYTSSETSFRILRNAVAETTYPRYVSTNSTGVGGIAELFTDVNAGQIVTHQYQASSTTSSARFAFTNYNYFLNQITGEYEQRSLSGITNNTRDWNQIACAEFNGTNIRDIEVVSVLPFTSSSASDLFQFYFNAKGDTNSAYDVNSPVMKRSGGSANQNGIAIHQYLFTDVNSEDVNICIYAKSSLGTITFNGGNVIGITANLTGTPVITPVVDNNSTIVIYDMNLFTPGDLTQNVSLDSYADIDVIFDFNADGEAIDTNSATVYYRAPVDDQNCHGVVRATKLCDWKMESDTDFFTATLIDTNRYNFISEEDDDHVFKPWVYNSEPDNFKVNDGNFSIYGSNRWVKALHTLVPTGPNYFYNFSFSATAPTGSHDLMYYDCNNDSTDPTTDPGCLLVSFGSDTNKDLDGFYSIKYNSDDNNKVGGISLNTDGNHWTYLYCPTCTVSDNWKIDDILENTNIDRARNWTSSSGLNGFTAITTTHNFHYHYLLSDQNNYVEWYVTLDNLAGTTFTSDIYRDQISSGNLPPLPDGYNSPLTNTYYKETIDINWNVYDPENDPLLCDFNILDSEENVVKEITDINASTYGNIYCIASFDSSSLNSGTYTIQGMSREYTTDFNFSRGSANTFGIDNDSPVTTISGCSSAWNNSSKSTALSCSDVNGSGCSNTIYSLNLSEFTNYVGAFTISADGNTQIDYNSTDDLNNIEETKTSFCAIDTNTPRVGTGVLLSYAAIYNSYVKGPVNIYADVNDLISGITVSDINTSTCEYSKDGGESWLSADYNSTTNKCEKNSVNLTNAANNVFRFKVIDNAGNTGTGNSSTTYISDSAAPTSTDNAPTGTVSGDIIVTISSIDTLSDVNGIYYCQDENDTCDPTTGAFVEDNNIEVPVTCVEDTCTKYVRYLAIDNLGNTETVNSSGEINFDNSVPEVGITTIIGFDIYSSYIKGTGNIVGGTITDIDMNIDSAGYTINGTDYNTCGSNCFDEDTNKIMISEIITEDEETYIFNTRIGHTIDSNYGYGTATITYTGDYTAPVTSDNYNDEWHDTNITVTLSTTENGSGIQDTFYCNSQTNDCNPITSGSAVSIGCDTGDVCKEYVRYYSIDNLDNNEAEDDSIKSTQVKIDMEKPTTTTDASNDWTNDNTITLTCDDGTGSDCSSTQYKLNNAANWTTGTSVEISTDGNHLLEYRSIDNAGNTEETKSVYVAVDTTAPTYYELANDNVWLNAPFNLYSVDVNFEVSGKSSAQVRINSESWIDINQSGDTYYTSISTDGNNTVEFNLTDNANNSMTGTVYGLLDTVLPVTEYSGCDSGWNTSAKTITFTCTDETSGCMHTYHKIDSGSFIDSNTLVVNTDGNHLIEYYSTDNATNYETQRSFYCAIDSEAPVIDSILNDNTYYSQDFNIIFISLAFGVSSFSQAKYRLNSGTWQNMITNDNTDFYIEIGTDGNNQVDYNFVDGAGNYTYGTTYGLIDREGPIFNDGNWLSPVDDYNFSDDYIIINGNILGDATLDTDINRVLISFDNEETFVEANLSEDEETPEELHQHNWDYNYVHGLTEDEDITIIVYGIDSLENNSQKLTRTIHYDVTPAVITLEATIESRDATIVLESNENVTCRISDVNENFEDMEENQEETGTTITWEYNNLANGYYGYYVVCKDRVDNLSPENISFRIQAGGGTRILPEGNATGSEESIDTEDTNSSDSNNVQNQENILFEITRIKTIPEGLILTRTAQLVLDDTNKTNVRYFVYVYNPTDEIITRIYVTEYIPKEIANNVSDINFTTQPTEIISTDPVVRWFISEILPKETIDLNYSVNDIENGTEILADANVLFKDAQMIDAVVDNPKKEINPTEQDTNKTVISWWWIVLLIMVIITIVFFILKKRRKKK